MLVCLRHSSRVHPFRPSQSPLTDDCWLPSNFLTLFRMNCHYHYYSIMGTVASEHKEWRRHSLPTLVRAGSRRPRCVEVFFRSFSPTLFPLKFRNLPKPLDVPRRYHHEPCMTGEKVNRKDLFVKRLCYSKAKSKSCFFQDFCLRTVPFRYT